jgi:hypothetical protein
MRSIFSELCDPCALAVSLILFAGCSTATPSAGDASPQPSAAPPVLTAAPATAAAAAAPASAASTATAASAAPAPPAASAAPEAPLPDVKVANIGMHIGGGPNDAETKAPIKLSVEPHFDAFRRCFALAEDPKKGGDFGVDLRIERDGGKAQITKPRTAIRGDGFTACMIGVFERVEFRKPKGGTTVVSYSLRFTP